MSFTSSGQSKGEFIQDLSQVITERLHRIIEFLSSNNDAANNIEVQYQLMRDMVRKYSQNLIQLPRNQHPYSSPSAVVCWFSSHKLYLIINFKRS